MSAISAYTTTPKILVRLSEMVHYRCTTKLIPIIMKQNALLRLTFYDDSDLSEYLSTNILIFAE